MREIVGVSSVKKLLVLANAFPYGVWETYMETEETYYSLFDKVWIGSLQIRKEHLKSKRKLKCGASVIPVPYRSKLFYLLNSFSVLADKELYKELAALKKSGRLSLSRIVDLFVFLSRAHHEARVIDRAMKNVDKSDLMIYSYRFEYQPYVALLLKKKWKTTQPIVCRAHGYDIYEERHPSNYIPLRKHILNHIDYLFPCSQYGVEYAKERYGKVKAVIECKYLGTTDHGEREVDPSRKPFKLVSCSNVIQVKRLEKIVNALSFIKDREIEWTHYGDGPLLNTIKQMAAEKLGSNIKTSFPGNVDNSDLLKTYAEKDYHLLLNVSASEGLPVSIMEAMSFGIPCAATNVGGTSEILCDDNGFLLEADVDDKTIAETIKTVSQLPDDAYLRLRKKARAAWNQKFNSETNYASFLNGLMNL